MKQDNSRHLKYSSYKGPQNNSESQSAEGPRHNNSPVSTTLTLQLVVFKGLKMNIHAAFVKESTVKVSRQSFTAHVYICNCVRANTHNKPNYWRCVRVGVEGLTVFSLSDMLACVKLNMHVCIFSRLLPCI